MTINSVNLDATAAVAEASRFNEPAPAGFRYVIINLTATYNGAEASDKMGVRLQALGASNKTMNPGGSSYPTIPEPFETFTEVFQGGSLTGNVLFEVPIDDVNSLLVIGSNYTDFDDKDRKFFATT